MIGVAAEFLDDIHFAARWLVQRTGSYYGHVAVHVPDRDQFLSVSVVFSEI